MRRNCPRRRFLDSLFASVVRHNMPRLSLRFAPVRLALASAFALPVLLVIAACATGTEETDIGEGVVPALPKPAATSVPEGGSYVAPMPSSTAHPMDPKDAGADAHAPTDAGDAGTTATGVSCTARTDCSGGEDLGTFSGDDNTVAASARTIARTGNTGAWFKLHLSETVNFILPLNLSLKADLVGPPTGAGAGPQFSLFVYAADNTTSAACSATPRAASGSSQSVALTITDSLGTDDSRDVYVEVRETAHAGAKVCTPTATWSLNLVSAE